MKVRWSLTKKLVLAFLIIVVVLFVFVIFSFTNANHLLEQYNLALQNNQNLESLFESVANSNQYLKNYFVYNVKDRLNQFLEEYNRCFRLIEEMKSYVEDEYSYYKLVDLERMMKTYGEYADDAIYLYSSNHIDESYEKLDDAAFANEIILERYGFYANIINETAENKRQDLLASQSTFNILEIIIFICLVIFCTLFVGGFIRSITKNVKKLVKSTELVSKGDFDIVPVEVHSNDEIAVLSSGFNNMVQNIRYYIKEIEKKADLQEKLMQEENKNLKTEALLKQTQLNALHTKINPHFLFNTLNIIKQTAYLENAEETRIMIETTAQLLRFYLDKSGMDVSLKEELENVANYIYIQNKRFGKRVKIDIMIDEMTSNVQMPGLIIQPLIENAIIHGLDNCIKDGKIVVGIEEQEDCVKISVSDNGKGMEPSTAAAILNKRYESMHNSIGMGNVIERLELFYGATDLVEIESVPGKGSVFSIYLPKNK